MRIKFQTSPCALRLNTPSFPKQRVATIPIDLIPHAEQSQNCPVPIRSRLGAAKGKIQRRSQRKKVPRYHFDLVDSKTVADEGGADLPDDIAATDAADLIAKRLLVECPKLKNKDFAILVSNEDGDEVCRVPLDIIH